MAGEGCSPAGLRRRSVAGGLLLPLLAVAGSEAAPLRADLPGRYDPDSILARAVRGEAPVARLHEDRGVLAFLGDRPASRGHFLVVSRTSRARNFLEIEPGVLDRIMRVAQRVARAEVEALGAEGFTLRQNSGSASTIHQFHLHVIPRWRGDRLPEGPQPQVEMAVLEPIAAQVRAVLGRHR